ncbi:TetR/AcrR family transcriptional regulator [Nocardiopsis nanhaiensis]
MKSPSDGRMRRGAQTRRAVLDRAMDIASMEGLEGLSLGRLAKELQVSKSGVFAHFGSKEDLQLAAIEAGRGVFIHHVVHGALRTPPGAGRLWQLCESWIAYSHGRVFAGGCFFYTVTAEFESRPGKVRDTLVTIQREWRDLLTRTAEDARQLGHFEARTDPALLAFELRALMETANGTSVLEDDLDTPYAMAHAAMGARLDALATPETPRPWSGSAPASSASC